MKRIAIFAVLAVMSLGVFTQMTAISAYAEDATHGANGLLRRECPTGECTVGIGESAVAAVVLLNGTSLGTCFVVSAPSGVSIKGGVINYWAGEIAGKSQCNLAQSGTTLSPSSDTINGLARRTCPAGQECAVNAGEAVLGQSVWFQNIRYVNCFAVNVPLGVTVKDGGVINYWPNEPAATNAGQCSFMQGSTTPTSGGRIVNGSIPFNGFGLIVFSGGSTMELLLASGCPVTASFWIPNSAGTFDTYISGAPAFVNNAWNLRFANGIPANTPLIARCR